MIALIRGSLIYGLLIGALIALAVNAAPAAHVELRPFDGKSMDMIRAAHAGKPFVLVFWSTSCEPCRKEMALWRVLRARYPRVPILLVATDGRGEQAAVAAFLARYSPGPVQHWVFVDDFVERVRYSVDKNWRGELPRTYFFDARHQSQARSGLIDRHWAEQWFKQYGLQNSRG